MTLALTGLPFQVPVTVETCGHYLALTDDDFVRLGPVAKCAPPLRDRARQLGLWEAVLGGRIDCITSDHSPCPIEDKERGNDDVWAAWGGIAGIQTLVPLMLTEGVLERGLSLERFTALMSTNPAKIAGLWPRKGEIRIGADADLLLVDLQRAWRVEPSWLSDPLLMSSVSFAASTWAGPNVGPEESAVVKSVTMPLATRS